MPTLQKRTATKTRPALKAGPAKKKATKKITVAKVRATKRVARAA